MSAGGPRRAFVTSITGQDGSYLTEFCSTKTMRCTGLCGGHRRSAPSGGTRWPGRCITQIAGKRVLVTGSAGFLGRRVCGLLRARDAGAVIVPRSAQYKLTKQMDVRRLFPIEQPDIVVHLAAEVGGIGANRPNPGRYFYANLAMGLHIIEACRAEGVDKVVQVGTVCAYPKHTPVPFVETALWDGCPEETNAPYGIAKKSLLVMVQGYREQYGLNGIYLLPVNLYGPGDTSISRPATSFRP